jgi:hypothetical protein
MVTEAQFSVARESNPQRCFPVVSSQSYSIGFVCVCVLKWLASTQMILSPFLMQEQSTRLWVCVFKLAAVKLGTSMTAVSAVVHQ